MNIKITGTGSCIPKKTKLNSGFSENSFYDSNGVYIESSNSEIIEKFKAITGIEKRRYINDNETVADIAIEAAIVTIKDSKVDPETIAIYDSGLTRTLRPRFHFCQNQHSCKIFHLFREEKSQAVSQMTPRLRDEGAEAS